MIGLHRQLRGVRFYHWARFYWYLQGSKMASSPRTKRLQRLSTSWYSPDRSFRSLPSLDWNTESCAEALETRSSSRGQRHTQAQLRWCQSQNLTTIASTEPLRCRCGRSDRLLLSQTVPARSFASRCSRVAGLHRLGYVSTGQRLFYQLDRIWSSRPQSSDTRVSPPSATHPRSLWCATHRTLCNGYQWGSCSSNNFR